MTESEHREWVERNLPAMRGWNGKLGEGSNVSCRFHNGKSWYKKIVCDWCTVFEYRLDAAPAAPARVDDPVAFIDEDGRIVIVGEDAWLRCAFVDPDRAFPDSWTPLVRARGAGGGKANEM